MTRSGSKTRCKSILEHFVVLSVFIGHLSMELGFVTEMKAGFYCGDPEITHKYQGDTITNGVLLISLLFVPLVLIFVVEYTCHGRNSLSKREEESDSWVCRSLSWYYEYFFVQMVVILYTSISHVVISEPRPHFLYTCKPLEAVNCTPGYVADFTCTNTEVSKAGWRDSMRSFPSGHASTAVYLFIFCSAYLQERMVGVSEHLVALLQTLLGAWALVCSLTRLTDRRHHWWDVLYAAGIAYFVGMYHVCHYGDKFRRGKNRTPDMIPMSDTDKQDTRLYSDRCSSLDAPPQVEFADT